MFLKLQLDQSHGELRRIDRYIQFFEDIGQRSDMILMAVRKHESLHFALIFPEIGDIRNHQIDSIHVIFRKGKAAVYHHDRILVFERSDIHTDGFQSAKRYNLQF